MRRLKVLAICHEDPAQVLGGMGTHLRGLYSAMARRGDVEVDLLTSGPGEGVVYEHGYSKHRADKYVCWKPRSDGLACLLAADIQMMKTLSRLLARGERWDVVHVHEWNALQVGRAARDALMNVPLVGTMHLCITRLTVTNPHPGGGSATLGEPDLYLRQQEGHLVVTDSDELILCSEAYAEQVRETFMTDRPINVIHNGIDTTDWRPGSGDAARARWLHGLPDKPIALFVGRIAEMKGIHPLLDAVECGDDSYCFVFVGEVNATTPEEKEKWVVTKRMRALERERPDRFRWLGFRSGQELRDLYAAAAVGLMPSTHEPFGIVALEFMAMGVPLVSTEVDGLREVVVDDGGNEYAMIVPPRSSDAILEGLALVSQDVVASELRALGLRRARDFTWSEAADRTVAVYRKAIAAATRRLNQCQ